MARIEHDVTQWPLVVVRWPEEPVGDDDVELFLAESVRDLARGRQVALHVVNNSSGLNALQRRRFAAHVKEHEKELAAKVAAAAVVAKTPVLRAIVTAVNWFAPPPFPQKVFGDRAGAEAWLREHLSW